MRGRQIIRQWQLLCRIQHCRYMTVRKLAKELAVSTKTIHRDIAMLEEAGFPLDRTSPAGDERFFRMHQHWFLSN